MSAATLRVPRTFLEALTPILEAVERGRALKTAAADLLPELRTLLSEPDKVPESVPLHLICPKCDKPHVDTGEWATRSHRTHLCEHCGHEWRPFKYPTVGVSADSVSCCVPADLPESKP